MAERRRGLGKGIGALIPNSQKEVKDRPIDVFFGGIPKRKSQKFLWRKSSHWNGATKLIELLILLRSQPIIQRITGKAQIKQRKVVKSLPRKQNKNLM